MGALRSRRRRAPAYSPPAALLRRQLVGDSAGRLGGASLRGSMHCAVGLLCFVLSFARHLRYKGGQKAHPSLGPSPARLWERWRVSHDL
jgi:hypothetical protein